MKKHKPKILFTEQNSIQQQALRFFLEDKGADIYFCGRKTAEIINEIKRIKADVVVLDVYPTDGAAIEIKNFCANENLSPKMFIAILAFDNENVKNQLNDNGFEGILVKPYDNNVLFRKLEHLFGENKEICTFQNPIEAVADEVLCYFYLPKHLSGRTYLAQAIAVSVHNPQILNKMTSQLYPQIAERNNQTATNVERAMRNAIKIAWERGNAAAFKEYFKYGTKNIDGKPTNKEFIEAISERICETSKLSKSVNN